MVNSPGTPSSWEDFKSSLISEFIPSEHNRLGRDKLRKHKQTGSVEKYLAEYRNTILLIGDINEGEKLNRFVDGLKYNVKVEIMKTNYNSFEQCARMALNIDSAIWRARRIQAGLFSGQERNNPTPMEIGNVTGGAARAQREERKRYLSRGLVLNATTLDADPGNVLPRESIILLLTQ